MSQSWRRNSLVGWGGATPEQAYERQWALALLDEVYHRLEREHREHGKTELFAALRPALAGSREASLTRSWPGAWAERGNGARGVHRLRQRYRKVLRRPLRIRAEPREVEDEFRYLLRVLPGVDSSM